MKASAHPLWFGALLVSVVGLSGVAWRNFQIAGKTRSEAVAIGRRLCEAEDSIRAAEMRVKSAEEMRFALGENSAASVVSAARQREGSIRFDWVEWQRRIEAKERDPALQLAQIESARAKLRLKYGPLYRRANWRWDEIEAFESAISRRDEQVSDLIAAAREHDVPLDDPELRKLLGKAGRDYHEALETIFWAGRVAEIREYERILPVREKVSAFATTALLAGVPTTSEQNERLAATMAQASQGYHKGGDAIEVDWPAVDTEARAFLSPAQMALLQTTDVSGRFWSKFSNQVRKAQRDDLAATRRVGDRNY